MKSRLFAQWISYYNISEKPHNSTEKRENFIQKKLASVHADIQMTEFKL